MRGLLVLLATPLMAVRHGSHEQQALQERIRFDRIEGPTSDAVYVLPQKPRKNNATAETLMEMGAKVLKCPKGKEVWTPTGKMLGKGAAGQVMEVSGSNHSGSFALKEALDDSAARDMRFEVFVMARATKEGCEHVMPLTDTAPCVQTGKSSRFSLFSKNKQAIQESTYVAPEMEGDLFKWVRYAHTSMKNLCGEKILAQILDGMTCLHKVGFIHGDLKGDNVFYKTLDAYGCPDSLVLADFGLSSSVDAEMGKYESKYYAGCGHLPASMFMLPPGYDTLNLGVPGKPGSLFASKNIDRCSVLLMAWEYFRLSVTSADWHLQPGECGPMGEDRRLMLPLQK